jgi:single-stranded-DNA-specific exonuclease
MNNLKTAKKWLLRKPAENFTEQQAARIAEELSMVPAIINLLGLRGLLKKEDILDHLNPSLNKLPRPHLMKGMDKAVNILAKAVAKQTPVGIFGDFDADGITSTAVLYLFLQELKIPVVRYIPNRLTEGYGLNSKGIEEIYKANMQNGGEPGILLTVDCGISDAEFVSEAKQLGFSVIVTDHHKPPKQLPDAGAILNPLQPGCSFPFKDLAGVGVAFYLILGLRSHLMANGHWQENDSPNLKSYMDLVAIGTLADQVTVLGINRVIIKAGLEILSLNPKVGIRKLLDSSKFNGRVLESDDIAFRLAPRLNAAGRVGSAQTAVELLTTADPDLTARLAGELEQANNLRKEIERQVFDEAAAMAVDEIQHGRKSLLLYKGDWHAGVLGIVASRLTDSFNCPTILLTDSTLDDMQEEEELVKGSGRTIEGLDLFATISACSGLLKRFGGHVGAAGLTLCKKDIGRFKNEFETAVTNNLQGEKTESLLIIDRQTSIQEITDQSFLLSYARLSPFGQENPKPLFSMQGQKLYNPKLVGNNHLRFSLSQNGNTIQGIGFGFGEMLSLVEAENLVDIAFTLQLNSYMGRENWEIRLVDIKPS